MHEKEYISYTLPSPYIFICLNSSFSYFCSSPSKRSFRGPRGVEGLDLCDQAKICPRELPSLACRVFPVASRLLSAKIQNVAAAAAELKVLKVCLLSVFSFFFCSN